jgi:hypothetical protein
MELSISTMVQVTATIIAPITNANVLEINFRNVAIQVGTFDKLEDKIMVEIQLLVIEP